MEYEALDSSGTDDDLPAAHHNTGARAQPTVNGRTTVGVPSQPRVHNDMEEVIHKLEQEAYSSVLRAFKAQADAITWDQESLISNLRKELRISNDEHSLLLSRVNTEDIIQDIREWRHHRGLSNGLPSGSHPVHDRVTSPTVSAAPKRRKSALPFAAPSSVLHPQSMTSAVPPSSVSGEVGVATGSKGKKPQPGHKLKSLAYPSTVPSGRGQITNMSYGGGIEPVEANPLVGQKIMIRWPDDNNFYEADIADYKPLEGRHALVYDKGKPNESWEMVNLKEIPSEDIIWEDDGRGFPNQAYHGRPGHGVKQPIGLGDVNQGVGRRGALPSGGGKNSGDLILRPTETVMEEVKRVFESNHPDPVEIGYMKRLLKDQEDSLVDAISRIVNYSRDGVEDCFSHGRPTDPDRGWKNREYAESAWG